MSDLGIGGLGGDDAYYLGRAIRARDIMLGITQGRYDYFVVSDEYGRTSYLQLLTTLQVLFGPTPYRHSRAQFTAVCHRGISAVQAVPAGVRRDGVITRADCAAVSAFTARVVDLDIERAVVFLRDRCDADGRDRRDSAARRNRQRRAALVAVVICLWILDDLRRGALALGISGLALAIAARVLLATPRRAITGAAIIAIAVVALWAQPSTRARLLDATANVAKMHAGHVFTSGHAYKLLDEGFYMHPGTPAAWPLQLTGLQAGRFLVRAAASFVVTPLPWEMASKSELIFLPEHLLWLLIVLFLPIGAVVGWQRDATITACLLGFALPTAAVLAVTTGNVGTLLRLRGLVTPYLLWFAVLGGLAVSEWLLTRAHARTLTAGGGGVMSVIDKDGRVFGRLNLVDAGILLFVLLLIPAGYATFLLFRTEKPTIESVTIVALGNEERRVSSGTILTAKLKVKGSGFNPLMRARIDSIDAVGMVYENPNSVDVIVGVVPPGKHDLVLYDGVQEVARASGAVQLEGTEGPQVRAYGWLTDLTPQFADTLKAGICDRSGGARRLPDRRDRPHPPGARARDAGHRGCRPDTARKARTCRRGRRPLRLAQHLDLHHRRSTLESAAADGHRATRRDSLRDRRNCPAGRADGCDGQPPRRPRQA